MKRTFIGPSANPLVIPATYLDSTACHCLPAAGGRAAGATHRAQAGGEQAGDPSPRGQSEPAWDSREQGPIPSTHKATRNEVGRWCPPGESGVRAGEVKEGPVFYRSEGVQSEVRLNVFLAALLEVL